MLASAESTALLIAATFKMQMAQRTVERGGRVKYSGVHKQLHIKKTEQEVKIKWLNKKLRCGCA
jgi:hypothetical protein